MLAAHRDQENLVLRHQVPTKQAPKTPSRFGRRDENALAGFGGKGELGNGKLMVKGGTSHNLVTPSERASRAVLGDKTTNAKARTVQRQKGGLKDTVKEAEKSQARQTLNQKPKQKPASSRQLFLTKQNIDPHDDEPEYAPPRPQELPYQSDVLPENGLTFEGLKHENLFKGYYQHFCDPVDDDGVSRSNKKLDEELAAVLEDAIQWNEMETDQLTWNVADIPEDFNRAHDGTRTTRNTSRRRVATVSSRQAAAALATHPDTLQRKDLQVPAGKPSASSTRSTASTQPSNRLLSLRSARCTGEAASRTSIGYAKGRSTSSVLHGREEATHDRLPRASRTVPLVVGVADAQLTITPARMQQIASESRLDEAEDPQPQFLSIFEEHDDVELPLLKVPFAESDEDEEFEMRLDI